MASKVSADRRAANAVAEVRQASAMDWLNVSAAATSQIGALVDGLYQSQIDSARRGGVPNHERAALGTRQREDGDPAAAFAQNVEEGGL